MGFSSSSDLSVYLSDPVAPFLEETFGVPVRVRSSSSLRERVILGMTRFFHIYPSLGRSLSLRFALFLALFGCGLCVTS